MWRLSYRRPVKASTSSRCAHSMQELLRSWFLLALAVPKSSELLYTLQNTASIKMISKQRRRFILALAPCLKIETSWQAAELEYTSCKDATFSILLTFIALFHSLYLYSLINLRWSLFPSLHFSPPQHAFNQYSSSCRWRHLLCFGPWRHDFSQATCSW